MAPGLGGFNIPAPPRQNTIEYNELAPHVPSQRLSIFDAVAADARPSTLPRFDTVLLVLSLAALLGLGTVAGLMSFDSVRQGLLNPAAMRASLIPSPNTQVAARLIIADQRGMAGEPLPLGVAVDHASGGEAVTISGLPEGSELSLGSFSASAGWTVLVGELDRTFVAAPAGFVGSIDTTISLRSATSRVLDEQSLRLEWIARKNEQPSSNTEHEVVTPRPSDADAGGTVAQGPPRIVPAPSATGRKRHSIRRRYQ